MLGAILAAPLVASAAGAGGVVLVSSDFDLGTDGWGFIDADFQAEPPFHETTGGAPRLNGGFLRGTDSAGFFIAPSQFLGDQADAYGGAVTFYIKYGYRALVELVSGDTRIIAATNLDVLSADDWQFVRVPFDASQWNDSNGNPTVSSAQLACTLAHLERMQIFVQGDDTLPNVRFDRVSLVAPKGVAKGKAKPALLNFGEVFTGDTVTDILTITNSGVFGKTRALHLRFHDVPDNMEIIAPADFCGVVIPGQSFQFQIKFTATEAKQYDDIITLNTGTPDKPRFARVRVKATGVAPGSTIAGTWFLFGYAQYPVEVKSVAPNTFEATWTDQDIDHTRNVLRGTVKGTTWKGSWTWTAGTFTEKGTFTTTLSTDVSSHNHLDGSAHSRQGAITIGFVRPATQ